VDLRRGTLFNIYIYAFLDLDFKHFFLKNHFSSFQPNQAASLAPGISLICCFWFVYFHFQGPWCAHDQEEIAVPAYPLSPSSPSAILLNSAARAVDPPGKLHDIRSDELAVMFSWLNRRLSHCRLDYRIGLKSVQQTRLLLFVLRA
jgi:hypothetical protein